MHPTKLLRKDAPAPPASKPRLLLVSFEKYEKGNPFCLSICEERSVKSFTDCLRKICSMTLFMLYETSRKGKGKTGLSYTPYSDDSLKGAKRPDNIPASQRICGVREGDDDRLFGYSEDHVFFVIWFDSHHKVVPLS